MVSVCTLRKRRSFLIFLLSPLRPRPPPLLLLLLLSMCNTSTVDDVQIYMMSQEGYFDLRAQLGIMQKLKGFDCCFFWEQNK